MSEATPYRKPLPRIDEESRPWWEALARHELYVARYYLSEDRYDAALARVEYALSNYRDTGLEPEALVLLGETHLKKGNLSEARTAFLLVLERYKTSPFAEPAARFLSTLASP